MGLEGGELRVGHAGFGDRVMSDKYLYRISARKLVRVWGQGDERQVPVQDIS